VPRLFDRLRDIAIDEAGRRADLRRVQLQRDQARIAGDALERLGAWRERAEARVDERRGAQQTLLLDAGSRLRQAMYDHRMREIAERADRRRDEIEGMRDVRVESVDTIGALVLVPPQGWPDAS
jgi:hypothetical protein